MYSSLEWGGGAVEVPLFELRGAVCARTLVNEA